MALPSTVETILVATDFSDDAAAALDWAATVARERGARIVLAHAATVATPAAPEFIPLDARYAISQRITLLLPKNRERKPNLLALSAECRMFRRRPPEAAMR